MEICTGERELSVKVLDREDLLKDPPQCMFGSDIVVCECVLCCVFFERTCMQQVCVGVMDVLEQ